MSEIGYALLDLAFVPGAHAPKQRSPHRHVFAAVSGKSTFAANRRRDLHFRVFPAGVLRQQRKVGGSRFQRAGRRPGAFQVATPDEAREMLALKGGDNVAFSNRSFLEAPV